MRYLLPLNDNFAQWVLVSASVALNISSLR